jgi:hypothetical protein
MDDRTDGFGMPQLQPPAADALPAVPVITAGPGGLLQYGIDGGDRARALRDGCVAWLPRRVERFLPTIDSLTRRWLRRTTSPYVAEVEALSTALGFSGIWFLNGCYAWGCTALAREQDGTPWLARTLDWPFPGLGRRLEVVRLQSPAGAFDAVTWPGYMGCLTASAPGRFAASINQAPLFRRTRRPWLRPYDILLNAFRTWRIRWFPPDHLLRHVFETCRTYAEARQRLETTPIARPVIYTLVGCAPGERCVIERTEETFKTRTEETATANDWLDPSWPWEARVRAELMLTRSYADCATNSRTRRTALADWPGRFPTAGFEWAVPPVLNPCTRLAVELCPARGILRAVGYETTPGQEFPEQATQICELMQAGERTTATT